MSDYFPIEGIENNVFFFVRFGEKEHLESLKNGNLFMHSNAWHQAREEKDGEKGQGDKYDGKLVMSDFRFEFRDPETNALLLTGFSPKSTFHAKHCPIFCLYAIRKDNVVKQEIDEINKQMTIEYGFSDEQLKYFREAYKNADSAMIIQHPKRFVDQIYKCAEDNNLQAIFDIVKYSDFSINDKDRLQACFQNLLNAYYWKDNYFRLEQEFRFVFPDLEVAEDHVVLPIGKIEDAHILDIEKFFDLRIVITFNLVELPDDESAHNG